MSRKIIINGREYSSVEEMPPDARQQYAKMMNMLADKDGNGIPDIVEGKSTDPTANPNVHTTYMTESHFVINGKKYEKLEDVPEEFRQTFADLVRNKSNQPQSIGSKMVSSYSQKRLEMHDTISNDGLTIRISWPVVLGIIGVIALWIYIWYVNR
jgi:hypothetical protein